MPSLEKYGLLNVDDAKVLTQGVILGAGRFSPCNIVEIGVNNGNTARSIAAFLGDKPFTYTGIDNQNDMKIIPPFTGAKLIIGESQEVFSDAQLPDEIHLLIIDGCHCVNHVMMDFLHYSPRIPLGGLLFFHDTAAPWQGLQGDKQPHGPQIPEFCIGVLKALKLVSPILDGQFGLVSEAPSGWGGARLYQRNFPTHVV